MEAHEQICPLCMQIKTFDAFGRDRSRPTGRFPYCRECKKAQDRARYATQPPRIGGDKTAEYIVRHIDFTAEPDGVGGYHHRYLGKGVNTAKSVPLIQRLALIADGRPLPTPVYRWCEDTHPWCVSLDHITTHGDLPLIGATDEDEFEGGTGQGMQWLFAEQGETMAHIVNRLDSLNGDWDKANVSRDLERMADRILSEAGYNRWGEPYKRSNPRKGRVKKVA